MIDDRFLITTDPMERIIERALLTAGIPFTTDMGGMNAHCLDFDLPDHGIAIEVKQMHSPRISDQMSRAPHVVVAQGRVAVEFLAAAITALRPT